MIKNTKTMAAQDNSNGALQTQETCSECGTVNNVTRECLTYQHLVKIKSSRFYLTFFTCSKCRHENVVQVDTDWTKKTLQKLTELMARKARGEAVSNVDAKRLMKKLNNARANAKRDYERLVSEQDGD